MAYDDQITLSIDAADDVADIDDGDDDDNNRYGIYNILDANAISI